MIAHEYFHNWTGNRITCRDWFQLSLKEGLTVFRDQEFTADMISRPVKRIQDANIIRSFQFREDGGPMAHPVRPPSFVEINNFYTLTVYNKGAEVIRMLHTLLGPETFRRGMDLYFERHDGKAVTCDDFVAAMESCLGPRSEPVQTLVQSGRNPRVDRPGRLRSNQPTTDPAGRADLPAHPGSHGKTTILHAPGRGPAR